MIFGDSANLQMGFLILRFIWPLYLFVWISLFDVYKQLIMDRDTLCNDFAFVLGFLNLLEAFDMVTVDSVNL